MPDDAGVIEAVVSSRQQCGNECYRSLMFRQ